MENKVSQSNITEIIALLWLIMAILSPIHWLSILGYIMAVENVIESIYWAFKFKN